MNCETRGTPQWRESVVVVVVAVVAVVALVCPGEMPMSTSGV